MNEAQYMEQWARETGAWALQQFNDAHAAPPRRKADHSWVTDVDETVERELRRMIRTAYPDDAIMGEEGGGAVRSDQRVWVLDPIDGTGSFVKRLPVWCVSIGLVVDGYPRAGCVFLPVTDECYLVGLDGPATLNGQVISAEIDEPFDSQAWMAVPSNAHRRYAIKFPGKTRSLGSTAANICYVARGGATGAVLGRSNLWDIAGAVPVLERAGGRFGTVSGDQLDWPLMGRGEQSRHPLFAAHAAIYDKLLGMISER